MSFLLTHPRIMRVRIQEWVNHMSILFLWITLPSSPLCVARYMSALYYINGLNINQVIDCGPMTHFGHWLEKWLKLVTHLKICIKTITLSLVEILKILYLEFHTFFVNDIASKWKVPNSTILANIVRFLNFYQLFIFNFLIFFIWFK